MLSTHIADPSCARLFPLPVFSGPSARLPNATSRTDIVLAHGVGTESSRGKGQLGMPTGTCFRRSLVLIEQTQPLRPAPSLQLFACQRQLLPTGVPSEPTRPPAVSPLAWIAFFLPDPPCNSCLTTVSGILSP